jgi:type I restriction enzyme S subunit
MIATETKHIETRFKWFNDIPATWNLMRLKNICGGKLQYGINIPANKYSDDGIRFLRTTDINEDGEVIPDGIFIPKKDVPESYILQKGDLLFSRSGTVGRCYLHDSDEEYCFAGFLVKFKPESYLLSKWLYYTSLTKEFKYQIFSDAIESTISNFNGNKYAVIKIAFPNDKSELEKIIEYLDFKYSEIKNFIQTKQRFIELLKEQRQGIVNNIITKGIDNNINLVDSGFDWLGQIPNHWKMIRVKNVFDLVTEQAPVGNSEVLLSIYSAIGVKPRKDMEQRGNRATTTDGYWKVKQGDIIVNKLLAWMGAIGISEYDGVTSPAYDILRLKIDGNPFYYSELFRSSNIRGEFKKYSKGIMDVRLRLYFSEFGKIFIPVLPKDEQDKIVEHIKSETKTLDIAISKAEREIELIKEYREAMIAEAVTGKMKL